MLGAISQYPHHPTHTHTHTHINMLVKVYVTVKPAVLVSEKQTGDMFCLREMLKKQTLRNNGGGRGTDS